MPGEGPGGRGGGNPCASGVLLLLVRAAGLGCRSAAPCPLHHPGEAWPYPGLELTHAAWRQHHQGTRGRGGSELGILRPAPLGFPGPFSAGREMGKEQGGWGWAAPDEGFQVGWQGGSHQAELRQQQRGPCGRCERAWGAVTGPPPSLWCHTGTSSEGRGARQCCTELRCKNSMSF